MQSNRRVWSTTIVTAAMVGVALLQPTVAAASQDRSAVLVAVTTKTDERSAVVRVNQVGYPTGGAKVAFAMLPAKVAAVRFEVVTPYGVAYRGTSTDDVGSRNSGYRAAYQLSFSGVRTPGQYQVSVEPADDYTANSLLAFALGGAGLG